MIRPIRAGFVCFGEVNTPAEVIERKRDQALSDLKPLGLQLTDAGIVSDDSEYKTADLALSKLRGEELDVLIACVAGWIPSHAVVRVTDPLRHLPILLWGLCGWMEGEKLVTTADQAGTTALRPIFEEFGYRFQYVYSIVGEPAPVGQISAFLEAARAASLLRNARVGSMGYRDMLLYGTQFEGNSLRAKLGVEVEPFEMLEMVQNLEKLEEPEVASLVEYINANWKFQKECEPALIERGARYALAIGTKIRERHYDAVTLIDVDGMKKLLSFPPAMVFMLLDHLYGVQTIPENDVMGSVTQLMISYLTGETAAYLEFYEFFKDSVLIGVPDFIPKAVTQGEIKVLPTAFGLLSASLLNVSSVRPGRVTLSRLIYRRGRYYLHLATGEASAPPAWEECGWTPPAPQLPSLRVKLDCPVEEFAQKVSSQHTIISYGDQTQKIKQLCSLLDIEVI